MAVIELPCSLVLAGCDFEVELKVEVHWVGEPDDRQTCIERVTLNGSPITLTQEQYEELAEEVSALYQ